MEWFRTIANPRLEEELRIYALEEWKEWVRKLQRANKAKKINIKLVQDQVVLDIFNLRRGRLGDCNQLMLRLKAVKCDFESQFPSLPTPSSVASTPSSSGPKKAKSQGVLLAGSEHEGEGTVVSATAPQLEIEPLSQAGERPLSVASSLTSTDLRELPSDSSEKADPEKEVSVSMMWQMILQQKKQLDTIVTMLAKPAQVGEEKATSSTQQVVEAVTVIADNDRELTGSMIDNDDEEPLTDEENQLIEIAEAMTPPPVPLSPKVYIKSLVDTKKALKRGRVVEEEFIHTPKKKPIRSHGPIISGTVPAREKEGLVRGVDRLASPAVQSAPLDNNDNDLVFSAGVLDLSGGKRKVTSNFRQTNQEPFCVESRGRSDQGVGPGRSLTQDPGSYVAGIPALQTRGKATLSVGGSNTGLPGNEHSVELPSTTSWCEPSNIPQSLRDAMDEVASCSVPRRKECQRVRQSHLPQNMAGTRTGEGRRQVGQRVLATPASREDRHV